MKIKKGEKMLYRFQINDDSSYGADYGRRMLPSCQNFLNKEKEYASLDAKTVTIDLIGIILNSGFKDFYKQKLEYLSSENVYKILVLGVGRHDSNEITLKAKNNVEIHELAHIDRISEEGSWMNRLYVCLGKPDLVTFCNKKIHKEKKEENIIFNEQYAFIRCDF